MSQAALFRYFKKEKKFDLEVLICEDYKEAQELESVAKFFKHETVLFPDFRPSYGDDLRVYKEELHQLFTTLRVYHSAKQKPLVIAPLKSLLFHLPQAKLFETTTVEFGTTIDLKAFKEKMLFWGYSFVDMVQVEGEISFRGDIIDIYPPTSEQPYRISLFDDEVEQIKAFELESQRTDKEELESVEISPAFYALSEEEFTKLDERVKNSEFDALVKDVASLGLWHLEDLSENFLEGKKAMLSRDLEDLLVDAYGINNPQLPRDAFHLEKLDEDDDYKELIVADVPALLKVHKDKKITIIASNDATFKQFGLFDAQNITKVFAPYILNVITPDELVISLNKPDKKRRRRKSSILLDDLKMVIMLFMKIMV